MSTLLALAADYIERMANPVFGVTTNEDYAIKFGKFLDSEDFQAGLRKEIETLDDPHALSSYGWLWLFDWAKSTRAELSPKLLLHLFHEWASPFVRAEIVQLATRYSQEERGDFSREETVGDSRQSVYDFPDRFLAQIMIEVTSGGERKGPENGRSLRTPAHSVLVAFLQADLPISLDAASVLLRHQWEGQRELLDFFWALVDSLDEETGRAWLDRLNPPLRRDRQF